MKCQIPSDDSSSFCVELLIGKGMNEHSVSKKTDSVVLQWVLVLQNYTSK